MKNNNIIKLLWLFVVIASFSSCTPNKDESFASVTDKPKVSLPVTSYNVTEGDDVQVTLVADHPYKTSMDFSLEVIPGGTANDVDDFAVNLEATEFGIDPWNGTQGYHMSFPANTTSYTFSISSILDGLAEGTENVTFKLKMYGNRNGVLDSDEQSKLSMGIEPGMAPGQIAPVSDPKLHCDSRHIQTNVSE